MKTLEKQNLDFEKAITSELNDSNLNEKNDSISFPTLGIETTPELSDKKFIKYKKAKEALSALKKSRANNNQQWLNIGMALSEFGSAGLMLWKKWSRDKEELQPGSCAESWATFADINIGPDKISLDNLFKWAEQDSPKSFIRPAPKHPKPIDYAKALSSLQYKFSLNVMNDEIYVNDQRFDDLLASKIMTDLRQNGYKDKSTAIDLISAMALKNKFHPIKDYLDSLEWDGENHFEKLNEYIKDKDGVFPTIIKKWFLGAVGRNLGSRPGQHHPILVLDGSQGLGKSRFVTWLGSPLPEFYLESAINPEDKDYSISLYSNFVWEVVEMGSTMRKSDLESLKAFFSKERVKVRKPYGRFDTDKPATVSFIGTVNNSSGFLADPTGYRRFRVCTLTDMNWAYSHNLDVNQLWAQAVALFKGGETWELSREDEDKIQVINSNYEAEDPLEYNILTYYSVDPKDKSINISATEILNNLKCKGLLGSGTDRALTNQIASVLKKFGCEKIRIRKASHQIWCWLGVKEK